MLQEIHLFIDSVLITPYRLPDNAMAGFLLGTYMLTMWCILIGELTLRFVRSFNQSYYDDLEQRTVTMHNLSVKAILSKDKQSYRACNQQANDAFGRYFFAQTALGASSLWMIPFALNWMDYRFHDVSFTLSFYIPWIGNSTGYVTIFILIYLVNRILYAAFKRMIQKKFSQTSCPINEKKEELISWADLAKNKTIES